MVRSEGGEDLRNFNGLPGWQNGEVHVRPTGIFQAQSHRRGWDERWRAGRIQRRGLKRGAENAEPVRRGPRQFATRSSSFFVTCQITKW